MGSTSWNFRFSSFDQKSPLAPHVDHVESGSGGWVQIGTYEENRLWPSRCRKVAKSVVEEEVTGDYTKFIGKEIALSLVMKDAMVYTVGFE